MSLRWWHRHRKPLLVIYALFIISSGGAYYNWQPIASLIYRAGGFSWECPEGSKPLPPGGSCEAQRVAATRQYVIGYAIAQASGIVSGAILDYFGARLTATSGQLLFGLGWVLLGASAGPIAYQWGLICVGLAANLTTLPTSWLATLFPSHSASVLALFSACIDISLAVPILLDFVWQTFFDSEPSAATPVFGLYTAFITFPFVIAGLTLFPKGPAPDPVPIASRRSSCITRHSSWAKENRADSAAPATTDMLNGQSANARSSNRGLSNDDARGAGYLPIEETPFRGSLPDTVASTPYVALENVPVSTLVNRNEAADARGSGSQSEEEFKQFNRCLELRQGSFFHQFFSLEFFCFMIHFTLCSFRTNFFNLVAREIGGSLFAKLIGMVGPFASCSCIVLGYLVDMTGILNGFFIMNTLGVLMILSAVVAIWLPFIGILCTTLFYLIHTGFVLSQAMIFVSRLFGTRHYGKFVGFTSVIDGCNALAVSALYKVVLLDYGGSFNNVLFIMLAIAVSNYALLAILLLRLNHIEDMLAFDIPLDDATPL